MPSNGQDILCHKVGSNNFKQVAKVVGFTGYDDEEQLTNLRVLVESVAEIRKGLLCACFIPRKRSRYFVCVLYRKEGVWKRTMGKRRKTKKRIVGKRRQKKERRAGKRRKEKDRRRRTKKPGLGKTPTEDKRPRSNIGTWRTIGSPKVGKDQKRRNRKNEKRKYVFSFFSKKNTQNRNWLRMRRCFWKHSPFFLFFECGCCCVLFFS